MRLFCVICFDEFSFKISDLFKDKTTLNQKIRTWVLNNKHEVMKEGGGREGVKHENIF